MSKRMENYNRAAGRNTKKKKLPRKETIWELVKRAFSHERNIGIVEVSTIPLITERFHDGKREIITFMVKLPRYISEEKLLEAINHGFGFLAKETEG